MAIGKLKKYWKNIKDYHIYLILTAICVVSRLPFLSTFELVSYDGTYYLGQSRAMFGGDMPGGFPIGYPLVVKMFQVVLRDYQVAGMAVSFLAGVGSAILLYRLAARFVGRGLAFLVASVFAINPLFIRFSLMTMSESVYICWVLLGLLMYAEKRWMLFGLAMGMAAITRPEALVIVGLLGLSRIRRLKQVAIVAVAFLAVYAINVTVLSTHQGRLILVPKMGLFGSGTEQWELREATIEFKGREQAFEGITAKDEEENIFSFHLRRMPNHLKLLADNTWPAILLLSLFAMRRRKYLFLMTGLVAFFVTPLFTPRMPPRFILPYIPILYLLAVLAVGELKQKWWRWVAVVVILVTAAALPAVNRDELLVPEDPLVLNTKTAALELRDRVDSGDKVGARKPFFAFYTGGDYVEIPIAPYDDIMTYLLNEDVKFIELHQATIHQLRPMLRPLMYSTTVMHGELRFRQVYFDPSGEMVLERTGIDEPLQWTRVTSPTQPMDVMPAWSPDGQRIAFRSRVSGEGIFVVEPGKSQPRKITGAKLLEDELSWSPDGKQIAFANGKSSRMSIYTVEVASGDVRLLIGGDGNNVSPSWSPTGAEIVFCSDRTGRPEIWVFVLADGQLHQLTTDGGNTRPRFSPNAASIAWIKKDQGVVIVDSVKRQILGLQTPRRVHFAPAWSPDSRYIAVTGDDWGSQDIYLCKVDGTGALLLTKNQRKQVHMPAWSPDGSRIALASDLNGETTSIWVIEGLKPYLERLESPLEFLVFTPPNKR